MALVTNLDAAQAGGKTSISSIASFNRDTAITAYAAGNVVSDDGFTGKALIFPRCGTSGRIMHATLAYEEVDVVDFELYLFDQEPTGHADQTALTLVSADIPKLIGVYTFNDADKKTVAGGIAYYVAVADSESALPKSYTSESGSLYGLLVTRSVFTPVASAKVHLRLQLEID